ncbi:hypothetical protein CLV30_13231 [Haloactinopolyspora alba]|uniref:Uncharacterized protein n=1 Tax=Haloactinopolyspora alba TaxID=648780 RepID=A0A2P8D5B8_9ACTN|nr:hypothetical protein [Haloactinopolyspora alba]PSK92415.1 hypothetical protein CLV30_13231 [Haloactinopolyspora alba]
MTIHFHDDLHRARAEKLRHEAAVHAATRDARRARRLERAARCAGAVAAWTARVAGRIEAHARARRARVL